MIKLLQLSDLHIVDDADWHNLESLLLQTVKEKFSQLQLGEKLLVLTGDFHFYNETDYGKSIDFIKKLTNAMGIQMQYDVFLIPGNHDVCTAVVGRNKTILRNAIMCVKSDTSLLQDDDQVDLLLERFNAYSSFCQDLGVYSEDESPASVHVRTWRGELNIIHLNTCLVADGKEKQNQLIDTKKATSICIDNGLPCIAIGHNSFFDLHSDVQTRISALFYRLGVRAYLCGDRHKLEKDRYQQEINLVTGYADRQRIPNIVCHRSSADVNDDYSDIGCIIHEWDTASGDVALEFMSWDSRNEQSRFDVKREEKTYNLRTAFDADHLSTPQRQSHLFDEDSSALEYYRKYIKQRCSEMDINGLPTNNEDIARKYELSKLFVSPQLCLRHQMDVPNLLDLTTPIGASEDVIARNQNLRYPIYVQDLRDYFTSLRISEAITARTHDRLFEVAVSISSFIPEAGTFRYLVLADPGAGKSTLLKRIASAYCFPEDYLCDSHLTDRNLFPIWVRCRDIKDQSYSIWDAINSIPKLGEWNPELSPLHSFTKLVYHHVKSGTALLLIDGLDEIGSDSGRKSFVEQLNSFISNNPAVNVIITSREKGFSVISSQLFNDFSVFGISDLSEENIIELCSKWFSLVYGENEEARKDCHDLTNKIISNKRLKRLAKSPLMLTTLLLVDRRTGSLPTKRAGLYYEATKVLLETWNSEVHSIDAIDLEEAKNQLAYVAFQMTVNSDRFKNQIKRTELIELLRNVREECSNLVSGNVGSIDTVIKVIEQRSALLVQAGTERESDGHLEPVYEFQHTTFQEYLAAYAVSIGCFPDSNLRYPKGSVLDSHILNSNMKEVILLSAAMDTEIVSHLVDTIQKMISEADAGDEHGQLCEILFSFIADEAGLSKEKIHSILVTCRDEGILASYEPILKQIVQGKYKQNLLDFFRESDIELNDGYDHYSSLVELLSGEISDPYDYYYTYCNSEDVKQRAKALSVLANSMFLDKVSIVDKKDIIIKDAFLATRDGDMHVAKAGFDVFVFEKMISSNVELSYYIDSVSYYINTFNHIPRVITILEGFFDDSSGITISIPLSKESIELILNSLNSANHLSVTTYREKLFLAVCVALSCKDVDSMAKLVTILERITPNKGSLYTGYFRQDYEAMVHIVRACPTVSQVAEDATVRFAEDYAMKVEEARDQMEKSIKDILKTIEAL